MNTWQFTILLILFVGILFLLVRLVYKEGFAKVFNVAAIAARVRIILKSWRFVPVALVTINEKGEIILSNPKTTKDFGWSEDELSGKKMDFLIPKEYIDTFEKFKILYGADSVSDYIEIEGIQKNGKLLPIEVRVEKWKDEDFFKNPFYTIILRNIKHKKDNELAVREARKQIEKILDLTTMGMNILNAGAWSWDMQEDIIIADAGYNNIFDLKPWEIVKGKDLLDRVYFEDRNNVDLAMKEGFEKNQRYEVKYRVPQKDGSKNLILCIGIPELNKNNRAIKINGIIQLIEENVP